MLERSMSVNCKREVHLNEKHLLPSRNSVQTREPKLFVTKDEKLQPTYYYCYYYYYYYYYYYVCITEQI